MIIRRQRNRPRRPAPDVHNKSITPNKINVNPNVAVAFTNGSRPANARPNTIPYANVTTPRTTRTPHTPTTDSPPNG